MKNAAIFFFLASLTTTAIAAVSDKTDSQSYELHSSRHCGELARVQVQLDVGGDLKFQPGAEKADPVKMMVAARLAYDEQLVELPLRPGGIVRAVRHYDNATAELKIGPNQVQPVLRDQRRLIAVKLDGARPLLFSPAGPLSREELDLIDVPGCSAAIDQLLPVARVVPGDRWQHSERLMAGLLGLDEVRQNSAQSELTAVTDGVARIQISGRVEGIVDGAATQIELKGKYQFDTGTKHITWFGLLIKEDRKAGDVSSGLEVVARLQMQIAPLEQSPNLAEARLNGLPLEPSDPLTQLAYRSADNAWRLAHDRSWYLTTDDRDRTVFRLLDQGQRIAQCNISPLARDAAGKTLPLEQFQERIRSALGTHFGQFVQAGESVNPSKYRALRVVVRGEVSDLPIQWYYDLVTDDHGRQMVFTFTVANEFVDRFGDADMKLLRTLRFEDPAVSAKPTTATPRQ
jgi:hypothetical protein